MLKEKDSKQSIQVTIRVRPLSEKQKMEDPRVCVFLEQNHSLKVVNAGQAKKFTFDSICFEQSQQQMFERVGRRCTIDCLQGYNCTIFAYGQTGAGKTYTMMGVNSEHQNYENHKGLIPRTMKYLFQCIQKERSEGVNFIIRCSFLEIYNQQIIDLLNKSNTNLQLREDTRKGVYVQGITQEIVNRSDQVMDILNKGSKSRHVGSTFYNQTSSRSHSVFTMQIESRYSKNGVINTKSRQFNFIDLAGSERTKQSTGQRLKQGCNINKSLMNLASVINALSQVSQGKSQHVNYRNSKLTFLLKDSLGGNSKTNLIANISPAAVFYQQTLSTLGFARRAKLIKRQKACINEDSSGNLQSMKNEIKRLKQQVITLMGRLQSGEQIENLNNKQPAPQMTTIMHEYVAEEIDKQTRLQMEILKLNQRIVYLQNGLKQYSANDTHLRMIIAVLEDKIARLKSVQNALNSKAGEIPQTEVQIKTVKEYFQNQRLGLIKQLQSFKGQSEGTRVIKQLLKQARVVREDSDQEQTLKQLLSKNTEFLTMIHNRLDEMRPQRQEIELNAEFEKKISIMEVEYIKREQEQQERIEQINLQLNEARLRYEQNEKLLEEAIHDHIILEEKIKEVEVQKEEYKKQIKVQEENIKVLEEKIAKNELKSEELISELRNQISNKNMEQVLLRKQIQNLKNKVEKLNTNQQMLKQQFEALEQQKYKIDKILMQNIEQIKQQKNTILKNESQQQKMQLTIQNITSQRNQINTLYQKLIEQLQAEKKKQKTKLQEIQTLHCKQIENLNLNKRELQKQLATVEQKLKQTEVELSQQSQELQILVKKYSEMQIGLKNQLVAKQNKMKEVIQMMSKKEQNGNQIEFKFNQLQAQLINVTNQKEELFNKYSKEIEELKEKNHKQHSNAEIFENQLNEKIVECEKLNEEIELLKKQIIRIKQEKDKIFEIKANLQKQFREIQIKYDLSKKQIEELTQKEKQSKILIKQVNNQLFMVQKNKEIQLQALRSQLLLKQQHIENVEKQNQKNKSKLQRQIIELKEQVSKNKQSYEQHQNSLKKSLENQLTIKQKKITQLKTNLSQKQQLIKKYELELSQVSSQKDLLQVQKANYIQNICQLNQKVANITVQLSETKNMNAQLIEKHQKEMEQNQMIHNEQIDQKNQKIDSLMQENDLLNRQLLQVRQLKIKDEEKLLEVRQNNAHLEAQLSTLHSKYTSIIELSKNNKEILERNGAQMELCKENIQKLTNTNNELLEKISLLKSQTQNQKQLENYLKIQLQQIKSQLNIKEEENKSLKNVIINVRTEAEVMRKQIEEAISDSKSFTQEIQQLKQENQQLKISHSQTIKEMNQRNSQDQSYRIEQMNTLKTYNNQMQKRITQLETQRNQNFQNIEILNKSVKDFENLYQAKIKFIQQQSSIIQDLRAQIKQLTLEIVTKTQHQNQLTQQFEQIISQNNQLIRQNSQLSQRQQQISQELAKYEDQNQSLCSQLKYVQNIKDQINVLFEEMKQKSKKDNERTGNQISNLKNQISNLLNQINQLNQVINDKETQNNNLQEKITKVQAEAIQNSIQLQEANSFKTKCQALQTQVTKFKNILEEQQRSKERLYAQVCRERENNANFKLIIENSQAQIRQLQVELEEKDAIYKKLLQKIAKNQNQSKKNTNSQHYLKTIELLQKSRAQQLELRRQNQDLKKALTNMKQTLQQKQNYVRQVEKKSEGYCISMHKRLEEIQRDYCELQKNQQKIIKEKKSWQKVSSQNDGLRQEIKKKQFAINKLLAKQEDVQNRLKQCNLDYISLQKQFEQLKKTQIMSNNSDQKTNYINRLKAEVAALKTEKVLLTDSLNKERQEKTKLKSQIRFGKEDNSLSLKIDLQKKVNQNKNLQQLIFQIVSHLKICVNQPKTKLQAIRSVILGTIKEKFNQIKVLKQKIKQFEEGMQQSTKMARQLPLRQFKAMSLVNTRNNNQGSTEDMFKFQKEKDPTIMDNLSRQKMRQFQNHYARLKHNEQFSKYKNM